MPAVISVPGVYIEEDASPAISVSSGATAIPLFVGRFKPHNKKLEGVITRIGSWLDYSNLFDASVVSSAQVTLTSHSSYSTTADETETILVTSEEKSDVTSEKESKSYKKRHHNYTIDDVKIMDPTLSVAIQLYFQNGGGACYLYPVEKPDNEKLRAALPGLIDETGEITLFASPDPDEDYRSAIYDVLAASLTQHKGYFLLADSANGDAPGTVKDSAHVAVYYPDIAVSHIRKFDDSKIIIDGYQNKSIKPLATLNKNTKSSVSLTSIRANDPELADQIDKYLSATRAVSLLIPPSALMAGVYGKTDRERGVWKAPANVVLRGANDISVRITNEQQKELNPKGINAIRYFSERGLVVWGGRTQQEGDWRYISVRRLFDAAERDIKKALQPIVFEPNNQPTWTRVQTAIGNYLHRLWQQGALAGNNAEEAYFVRIGKGLTMTQDEINQGKMIIQVGMAAVRPAEFIILKFTQDMSQ